MTRRRLVLMSLVALCLIGGSYLVAALSAQDSTPQASLGLHDAGPAAQTYNTDGIIAFWRGRVETNPKDFISLTYLGQVYMRKGRETGDVANYLSAETAFRNALAIDMKYEAAQGFLSSDLFAMHEFQGALDQANAVYSNDPHALLVLATVGDAQMELGNYEAAQVSFGELLNRAPSPPVYSRLSRLAWLHGQTQEGINWMQRAVDEGQQEEYTGEEAAWYQFQLGELYFNTGQAEEAEKHYTAALGFFDHYYLALAGIGKVRAAQGRYGEAIAFYEQAVAIIPQPDLLAALGDLYALTGAPDKAKREYDTVEFIGKLAAINRQVYNRQLALFYANHDRTVDEALTLATKEVATRKDIYGYDALAWARYKNARFAEAWQAIEQAMKLGTRDALLYYHAGMIAASMGDSEQARQLLSTALAINPHFDLMQAPIAQRTLSQLAAAARR